jgi:hypothetical protein
VPNTHPAEAKSAPSEDLKSYLSALCAGTQDPIRLIYGEDVTIDVTDKLADALDQAGDEPVYLSSVTTTGQVPFLYTFTENAVEDEWKDLIGVQPTVVLFKDGMMITAFALETSADASDPTVVALAAAMGGQTCDPLYDPIPTPDANGWAMLHCDESVFTPLADLQDAYSETLAPAATQSALAQPITWAYGAIGDATLLSPFELDDVRYQQTMTVAIGGNRESKKWNSKPMSVAQFVGLLTNHREDKKKDGMAFVLAEILGSERKKAAVAACYGIGLDIDVGVPGEVIDKALIDLGCLAIRYTTHSHGKTSTKLLKDRVTKWLRKNGEDEVTEAGIIRFLREESRWDETIIASVEYAGDVQEPEGFMVDIHHIPMPKHRVVLPLAEPFVPTTVAKTHDEGMKMWGQACHALARLLGDLPLDRSAVDPSRLFYFPRHAPDRPHQTTIVGGDLLDWRTLDLTGEFNSADLGEYGPLLAALQAEEKRKGKSTTDAGRALGRWSMRNAGGFQIVDVIRDHADDRIRTNGSSKIDIECPFDEEHSDPGNPDDKGCFAVNAGDGPSDIFTIRCAHDSCSQRTNLDHLGKMIADGWFEREALDDPDYNALVEEPAPAAAPRMAGGVAVNGVLDGLDEFDPTKTFFSGPNAAEDAITALSKVASVVKMGNKMKVVIRGKDGLGFFSESEARLFFKPFKAEIEIGEDKKGNPKMKDVPAIDLLIASERRKTWEGIDCDPSNSLPAHVLNTWQGIEIAPAPGDCSLLKAHILNSTCAGDAEHAHYLTQWCAHMFQKPTEKPGTAPVIIGPKGCGKSTVADFLCRAIGRKHSVKIAQAKHLTGNFNAHLQGRLFVQAEEVTFGKDKQGEGPLKDMITAKSMLAEPKGLDAYQETNFSRFFLVSNPGHAVPASDGERRWLVLYARDLFAGKPMNDPERIAYFDALYEEAANGGIAAFLDYLMNYDLTGFTPFAAPETEGLADQKLQGLSDEDLWVYGILGNGQFDDKEGASLGKDWEMDDPLEIEQSVVRASYSSHVKRYGGSSGGGAAALKALERHGSVSEVRRGARGQRQRLLQLGTRREWRERFTERFGIAFSTENDE